MIRAIQNGLRLRQRIQRGPKLLHPCKDYVAIRHRKKIEFVSRWRDTMQPRQFLAKLLGERFTTDQQRFLTSQPPRVCEPARPPHYIEWAADVSRIRAQPEWFGCGDAFEECGALHSKFLGATQALGDARLSVGTYDQGVLAGKPRAVDSHVYRPVLRDRAATEASHRYDSRRGGRSSPCDEIFQSLFRCRLAQIKHGL